jgi:hypothetical protein
MVGIVQAIQYNAKYGSRWWWCPWWWARPSSRRRWPRVKVSPLQGVPQDGTALHGPLRPQRHRQAHGQGKQDRPRPVCLGAPALLHAVPVLQVHCPNMDLGCPAVVELQSRTLHEQECTFKRVRPCGPGWWCLPSQSMDPGSPCCPGGVPKRGLRRTHARARPRSAPSGSDTITHHHHTHHHHTPCYGPTWTIRFPGHSCRGANPARVQSCPHERVKCESHCRAEIRLVHTRIP